MSLEPIKLASISGGSVGYIASYPLACFSIIESLGFGILDALWRRNSNEARSLAEELTTFVGANPGCMHPLSDRFAASLIPAATALAMTGSMECGRTLLRGITKWICDQMETGFGIAGPYADPQEEVERVFGQHFDFLDYKTRRDSLFAVVLADLSHVFFPDMYPLIVNDLKAVGAIPSLIHALDVPGSLFLGSDSTQAILNLEYPDHFSERGLEHHLLQQEPRSIERLGGPLAPFICGCLCQDRVFTDTFPRLSQALGEGWGLQPAE
jgi:hypothetical protein